MTRKYLFCGGRDFDDADMILATMKILTEEDSVIITGGARGADKLAADAAQFLGRGLVEIFADWKNHGMSAGPIRNRQMLDLKPDRVFAFKGGRGTDDCCKEAERRGIPVYRYW